MSIFKNKFSGMELLLLLAISVYYLLPSVSYSISFFIPLAVCASYIFISGINQKIFGRRVLVFLLSVILISALYYFLTETSTISASVSSYNFKRFMSKINQVFFTFLPAFLSYRVLKYGNRKQHVFLISFVLALFGYVFYHTYTSLILNPNLARFWENFDIASSGNIGTYTFVYAVSIFAVSIVFVIFKSRYLSLRILALVSLIFIFSFLLLAQYTLAILIAITGVTISVIRVSKPKKRVFLVLSVFLVLPFIPLVLRVIIPYISSYDISTRLNEILDLLYGNGAGYNLEGRFSLYWKTIIAFLRSPIYGNRSLDFDGHSTFLTVLSDLGLLGALPYFALFHISNRQIRELLGKKAYYFSPVFFCLILMGLMNPIHAALPLSFISWFVAPLIISLVDYTHEEVTK